MQTKKIGKVLITGASGFLGCFLANYLGRKGYGLRLLDICGMKQSDFIGRPEFVQGDVRDYKFMRNASKDIQYIIHAAAVQPFAKPEDIRSINGLGIENVLKSAIANKVERVIYISSVAVYGIADKVPIKEDFPLKGKTAHAKAKIEAENICSYYRRDIVIPVFRAKPLVGPGRLGVFQLLFDWVKDNKKIPLIGSGSNKCQLLSIEDLSEAIFLSMVSARDKANKVFNIGAEKFGTIEEDLRSFFTAVGSKSRVLHFPKKLIKCCLKVLESMKISPIYEGVYEIIDQDLSVSVDRLKNNLSWCARKSNVDSLVCGYHWYLSHYLKARRENGLNNRSIPKQGILAAFKRFC